MAQIFYDNFSSDLGWTLNSGAVWERGSPGQTPPGSAYDGSNVIATDLDANYPDNISTPSYATSPVINCSAYTSVTISFRRHSQYENNSDYDTATVDVYDGASWQNVWNSDDVVSQINDSSWTLQEPDISNYGNFNADFQIRFGLESDGSTNYRGWFIDAVTVNGDSGGVSWDLGSTTATITGDNGGTDIVTTDTDISASSVDNSFNDSTSGFSGLTDGDIILVKGFTEFQNNGQFIVQSMTSAKIIVYEDLVTESAGDSVTIRERGPGYDTKDIVDAIASATYAETFLYPGQAPQHATGGSKLFHLKCKIIIDDDSLWRDISSTILMTWNDSNAVITFNNDYSTMELGFLNNTDLDKPVTAFAEWRTPATVQSGCIFSFMSSDASATLFSASRDGIFHMYGGMLKLRDDTVIGRSAEIGQNESYSVNFPDRSELIHVNVSNQGGLDFPSSGFSRIQECVFKQSKNLGVNISGTSPWKLNELIIMRSDIGLDFNDADSNDIRKVGFRGCTADVRVRDLNASQTIRLIDSDTIATVHGTMTFASGAELIESNSVSFSVIDLNGDGVDDVRALVYQKSSGGSTAYGSEQLSTGGATDTPAIFNEIIAYRYQYDSTHTTVVGRLEYGNIGIRLRLYGYISIDQEIALADIGIVFRFLLRDNDFIVTAKGTVSAYTGIAIDEGNSEIDITEAHTITEIYHWLHYKQAESGEVDIEELLTTLDGLSYTLLSGWSITGLNYIDLEGKYIVGKYVSVLFQESVADALCAVVKESDSSVLGSAAVPGGETEVSIMVEYTAATNIYVRSRKAGYKPFVSLITLGATGNTVLVNLVTDPNYT